LRENAFVDTTSAAKLLQLPRDAVCGVLDRLVQSGTGILERRGKTKGATYSLNKAVARDLIGKAAYTKARGIDPIRFQKMVRQIVEDHGSITPRECRELLGLGDSQAAKVEVSRLPKKWSWPDGVLRKEGRTRTLRYMPK